MELVLNEGFNLFVSVLAGLALIRKSMTKRQKARQFGLAFGGWGLLVTAIAICFGVASGGADVYDALSLVNLAHAAIGAIIFVVLALTSRKLSEL